MKRIQKNAGVVAACGLYRGACWAYIKDRCPGCKENIKATWCKIRTCCIENKYATCVDCAYFTDVNECKKFNNIFSKFFALVFRSNRKACIEQIREKGLDGHAEIMTGIKKHSLKR